VWKKTGFFVQFRQKEVLKFSENMEKQKKQAVLRTIRRMPAFAVFYSKEAISG